MFNEYYRWGILGAWIWVGIGCADSTSQVVDDKLAHITHEERMAISEPVPIPLSVPMIYQQGKDPLSILIEMLRFLIPIMPLISKMSQNRIYQSLAYGRHYAISAI